MIKLSQPTVMVVKNRAHVPIISGRGDAVISTANFAKEAAEARKKADGSKLVVLGVSSSELSANNLV